MKLVTVIMGQDCERFINMCIQAIQDSDAIVYLDGGSNDQTLEIVKKWKQMANNNFSIIHNPYDQIDPRMNGKQRNTYLNYVKEKYPDHWCLVIDADEIVEDIDAVKKRIQELSKGVYSVRMRHLIGDLAHEDSVRPIHFVPNRLFKISTADKYPEVEHPVLNPKKGTQMSGTRCTTIWHLAYIPNMWDIKKRYDNQIKKSDMHTPEFLKMWYHSHLFGTYPRKQFNPIELPKILLDEFGINKDELYFKNRGLELKHSLMVKQWYEHFKPKSVLDLGCGKGPYLYFWNWFVKDCSGIELSEWAIKNAFCKGIEQGDISNEADWVVGTTEDLLIDLITSIDVLEHLDDEELNRTLNIMYRYGKRFIFSIPFKGNPNLEADKTHKQFMTKEEWIKKIESCGIIMKVVPKDWLFKEQILIGEK